MTKSECAEVFALLSQYLDGELPPDLCQEMNQHISECPPCVEFLETLKRTTTLCRQLQISEQPGPLPEGAQEELREAYRRMREGRG